MLGNFHDHLRADPTQAAMVDRAIPVATRAALDGTPHDGMALLIKRSPASIICRAEDRNTGSINCNRNVSRAGIIADEEVQFADQCSEPSKGGLAYQVEWPCLHLSCH